MAEKRVSVRLSAVGGRQVRAEIEGVGEAGARGFGRLSREMDLANARLTAFAQRARIAAAAAAAALAAAATAAIRSALSTVDAQAKLAASLGTTVESIQVLARAGDLAGVSMGEIEQATKQLTRRLSEAAGGAGPAIEALRRLGLTAQELQALPLDQRIALIQDRLAELVPEAERAAVASDLFGDRTALVFSRIDTATLRQATQDVRDFGVVVSDQDARQIERTNDAISRLGLIWRGLSNQLAVAAAPALETVADAMAAVARTTGPLGTAIRTLFDNLGRLASYAATFAAFMAGRWVAAMAAAAFSVSSVATALVVLRGALIRTGIGALIVGVGELIYQFSQLVARVGSVGEAFRLLGDLAREVWSRMGEVGEAFFTLMRSSWVTLKESGLSALDSLISSVVSFGDRATAVFQGAYDAAVAIWGLLPGSIGDFAYQAANALIAGVEAMLNGVVSRINSFIEALNAALALLPEWATGEGGVRIGTLAQVELGRIGNPFEGAATAAGTAVADAFSAALSRTYVAPDLGLGAAADEAREQAMRLRREAILRAADAARPLASWQALNDAVAGTETEAEAALADAAAAAEALGEELDETGGAAGRAGAAGRQAGEDIAAGAEQALTGWQAVTAALADYAEKAREIGGEIGSALVGAFQSAENAIADFVKKGKLDFRDLVTSMIADLAKLAARRFILGPIANALSGALGGAGRIFANVLHAGGVVGAPGPGRMVSALAFAGAPRLHSGGWAGLRPDEVPAILQRGERVLSRKEAARYGQPDAQTVNITINARDAESFRQSRTQIAADIARAVALGRRGM
jgi:hypothetical protein